MASKRSQGSSVATAGPGDALRLETERLFQKERFKDAVKQAKLCYKEENSADNHRLVERAYFLRARQLAGLGMRASAVEVAQHLLDFGLTTSDWAEDFVRLLMSIGLGKEAFDVQGRFGAPEMNDRLVVMAADEAVVHPERADENSPEIARDANLVRQSIERLQAKDEEGSLLLLRDLARSSALSEWKFFVRGLAAHYRHDADDAKANWDRLDPERKASRIAQRLGGLEAKDQTAATSADIEAMERLAFGEPLIGRLLQVRSLAVSQDWDKLFRILGPLRVALRNIEPKLSERLTRALIGSIINEAESSDLPEAERLVRNFIRVAEPIAIDPNWNRLWAIIWDGPQAGGNGSVTYWTNYAEDLKTVSTLSSSDRALAQALVWNHIAEQYRDVVGELTDIDAPIRLPLFRATRDGANSPEVARVKKQVVDCLERSIGLAPDHLATYQALVEVYRDWDDPAKVESAARRLLTKFPDELATLMLLGQHYVQHNDLVAALPLVQKAREVKPLDDSLRKLEWTVRIGLARNHALAKRFDEGRAEFDAAEQLLPECRTEYSYLAGRVIFEAKASQAESSDRYLQQAILCLKEPTPLWLALLIESIRYRMSKSTQKGYAELWDADLKKKCVSETAGEMAALLDGFLTSNIEYAGRAGHVKKVAAYLQRSTRIKYRRFDIERVCTFLGRVSDTKRARPKLIAIGLKQHPESAPLHLQAGLAELGTLSFGGIDRARKQLEKARELAESSTDPKESALAPEIKAALTFLNEISSRRLRFPSFGDGSRAPFPGPAEDYFDDEFDDDDEDEFEDDDFGRGPFSMPPHSNKTSKQKRRQNR
jgi:tetratricopeptide (TPR) repeat protein